jgi:hypothetical protein
MDGMNLKVWVPLSCCLLWGCIAEGKYPEDPQNARNTPENAPFGLAIVSVQPAEGAVVIRNTGKKPVALNEIRLCWSESWYTKPGFNNGLVAGPDSLLQAGQERKMTLFSAIDERAYFQLFLANGHKEADTRDNCAQGDGTLVGCREIGDAEGLPKNSACPEVP